VKYYTSDMFINVDIDAVIVSLLHIHNLISLVRMRMFLFAIYVLCCVAFYHVFTIIF